MTEKDVVVVKEGSSKAAANVVVRKGGGTTVSADASFLETLDQTASVLDLHRSNLLRLQAEELLNQCRLLKSDDRPPSWTSEVAPFVEEVSSILQESVILSKINESTLESCPFLLLDNNKKKILESFSKLHKKERLHVLPFVPPATSSSSSSFLGRGSCALTTATGNANVLPTFDLVVQLPACLWDAKDYKNHRYFDKRNLVVWHVAQILTATQKKEAAA